MQGNNDSGPENFQHSFSIADPHGHFQQVQTNEQRNKSDQDTVPNQILCFNVDEFPQNSGKPPHENYEVHQNIIPELLKHAPKLELI